MRHFENPTRPVDAGQATQPEARRPYLKPEVRHEQVFETMALACGKLRGTQGQCRRLASNS